MEKKIRIYIGYKIIHWNFPSNYVDDLSKLGFVNNSFIICDFKEHNQFFFLHVLCTIQNLDSTLSKINLTLDKYIIKQYLSILDNTEIESSFFLFMDKNPKNEKYEIHINSNLFFLVNQKSKEKLFFCHFKANNLVEYLKNENLIKNILSSMNVNLYFLFSFSKSKIIKYSIVFTTNTEEKYENLKGFLSKNYDFLTSGKKNYSKKLFLEILRKSELSQGSSFQKENLDLFFKSIHSNNGIIKNDVVGPNVEENVQTIYEIMKNFNISYETLDSNILYCHDSKISILNLQEIDYSKIYQFLLHYYKKCHFIVITGNKEGTINQVKNIESIMNLKKLRIIMLSEIPKLFDYDEIVIKN